MYRKHYGFNRHPFSKEIAHEDLFAAAGSKELQSRLMHLIEMRGIGLVTGDSGSGKTTACRKVIAELHAASHRIIYVPNSTGNVMDLYKSVAWDLGLPCERSRAALYRQIRTEVTRLVTEARCRPILIVDEAHHLRPDVLEDLRLLTNYQMDAENRLCLLLVGQSELRRRLSMSVYEALSQRIVVRYHLPGLTRDELPKYLEHLLKLAGVELSIFDAAAIEAVYGATQGLPRKVSLLCHHALLAGAASRSKTINIDHIQAAMTETN